MTNGLNTVRVWIIVHDLLDRRDEVGRREWKGEVHLSQILKAGKSPLEIKLRRGVAYFFMINFFCEISAKF